jgi:transcriptional regulator with XRE-family HTH domain
MIRYPHPAFPNLYLLNGYSEVETPYGPAREYAAEDDLERCIRRLVLRKPFRLRGWDLRFLRRGLGLSQTELGEQIGRDAQTIARWEKSEEELLSAVDLAIRVRYAVLFEPHMTTRELISLVDGTGPELPDPVFLRLAKEGWRFEPAPTVKFAKSIAHGDAYARVVSAIGFGYRLFERPIQGEPVTLLVERNAPGLFAAHHRPLRTSIHELLAEAAEAQARLDSAIAKITVKSTGSTHADTTATIH